MKYPALDMKYSENDNIKDNTGNPISTVLGYWKWAHSNLMDNAERGIFAEYLVALAIGGAGSCRINWEKYDLKSTEGITVEVKSSAYIQVWGQNTLSAIRFGIAETLGYEKETNTYESEKKRQAQVYVFCVHNEKEQKKINLLDMNQWDFYVISSKIINDSKEYSKAKSISLNSLIKLGAVKCGFEKIHVNIIKAVTS